MICPLSFETRRPLEAVCGLGYTVIQSPLNTFWATDLLHCILHVPEISENVVDHYAKDYETVIELTETYSNSSIVDSETLGYFAIDVYANVIAAPGMCCHGEEPEHNHASATSIAAVKTAAAAATSANPSVSATTSEQATGTTTAPTVL